MPRWRSIGVTGVDLDGAGPPWFSGAVVARITLVAVDVSGRRELPHAHLTRYERAGHMLVLERADRFAHDVDTFARRTPRGSQGP